MQKVKRLFKRIKQGILARSIRWLRECCQFAWGKQLSFHNFCDADKRYLVTAKLGERADTSDAEGQVVETREVHVETQQNLTALEQFRGDILQCRQCFPH